MLEIAGGIVLAVLALVVVLAIGPALYVLGGTAIDLFKTREF